MLAAGLGLLHPAGDVMLWDGPRGQPHLSTCQNAMWDGWDRNGPTGFRYCGQPVLSLGIPSERDICQVCRDRAEVYGEGLLARWTSELADPAEWLAITSPILANEYAWLEREAAGRAPLSRLAEIRRGIERRERCVAAVEAERVRRLSVVPDTVLTTSG